MLIFVDFCGFWISRERTLACLMFVCHSGLVAHSDTVPQWTQATWLCGFLITLSGVTDVPMIMYIFANAIAKIRNNI